MSISPSLWIVYWLFDTSCTDHRQHGYVGVTCRFDDRVRRHRKRRTSLFEAEVLFTGTEDQCYALERELRPHAGIGWNLTAGGPAGYTRTHCEATREKMRKPKTEEHKRKTGLGNKGKVRTPEQIEVIRQSRLGKPLSVQARAKVGAATRERIRINGHHLKGTKRSKEAIAKMKATVAARQNSKPDGISISSSAVELTV